MSVRTIGIGISGLQKWAGPIVFVWVFADETAIQFFNKLPLKKYTEVRYPIKRSAKHKKRLKAFNQLINEFIKEDKIQLKMYIAESSEVNKISLYWLMIKYLKRIIADTRTIYGKNLKYLARTLGPYKYPINAYLRRIYKEPKFLILTNREISITNIAFLIAKQKMEHIIHKLHLKYPQYNWIRNGMSIRSNHRDLIKKYGPCPEHRVWVMKSILKGGNDGK